MYFFCVFKGYMIVCCTNSKERALSALVKYTRETKGNILYGESQIRNEAKVNRIDMVDDIGYLSGLQDIENNIKKIKEELDDKINRETQRHKHLRDSLRKIIEDAQLTDSWDTW